MFVTDGDADFVLKSSAGKVLVFNTALVLPKATRDTQGVQVMRLTKAELTGAYLLQNSDLKNPEDYRIKTIPSAGSVSGKDISQLSLF